MFANLRKLFGVESLSNYVLSTMTKTNLDIVGYESIFFSMMSGLLILSSFFPIHPWIDKPAETTMLYRTGFLAMSVACIAIHMAVQRVKQLENRSLIAPLVMLIYIIAVMGISMWLTLFDFAANRSLLIYVSSLVLLFGVIYLPPIVTFSVTLIFTLIMIYALASMGFSGFVFTATLFAYDFLAVTVASSGYHTRLRATIASEEAHIASIRDELTGLKNRRALGDDAEQFIGRNVFVLLGDIDEFKFYNDSFGHAAGDHMLKRFANCMTEAFGEEYVYRYGGDECVAVMRDVSEEQFLAAVTKWRESFVNVKMGDRVYSPTTSGGYVSGKPTSIGELQEMLRIADLRLYDSKLAGRNTVLGAVYNEWSRAELASGMQKMLEQRSGNSDPLTGLPSISYFYAHAKTVIDSPKLADTSFNIVYFNVDNLKIYNERFGMTAGDELLVFVARTIEASFEHALVTRFSDDRFVMLTYGDDLMEGLERVYSQVLTYNNESHTIIRAGVLPYDRGIELSTACDRAKLACDHIKGHYNVYYCIFDDQLIAERDVKQLILDRFDEALEKGYIHVHYQPIIRTISGRVSDVEALARWTDPVDGPISPAEFVPVLEEFRLIHKLDLRMMELICADCHELTKSGRTIVPVNINLSRYDLELCDIVEETVAIMRRYDIPPSMMNIEITESAFSERNDLLSAAIDRFHEYGLQVWMDDFGSGYSSLNMLREYAFDTIKIDLGFLQHHDDVSRMRARTMMPYIIGMAMDIGFLTLVEGVETQEQYELLKKMGCGKVQGFAFAHPMPLDQMIAFMKDEATAAETPAQRQYYDAVASVNLLKTASLGEEMSHKMELSSGLPAAIVQFSKGKAKYLNWNSSYLDYLRDIGMGTIENSENQMNDMSRPQSQGFHAAAKRMRGSSEWLNLTFYEGEDLCTGAARCIAVNDEAEACAFIYMAFNISSFLDQAGYSIPK